MESTLELVFKIYEDDTEKTAVSFKKKTIIIGRDAQCDISIVSPLASRIHAEIKVQEENIVLKKISKFGPLKVNGEDVTETVLKPNDKITIDHFSITYASFHTEEEKSFSTGVEAVEKEAISPITDINIPTQEAYVEPTKTFKLPEASENDPNSPKEYSKTLLDSNIILQHQLKFSQSIAYKKNSAPDPFITLDQEYLVIGRETTCDIILPDDTVSAKHAQFIKKGNYYILEDLDSHFGILVNGKATRRIRLSHNDIIRIGAIEFLYEAKKENATQSFNNIPNISNIEFQTQEKSKPSLVKEKITTNFTQKIDKKLSLLEKFRNLPPKKKMIASGIIFLAVILLLFTDPDTEKKSPEKGDKNHAFSNNKNEKNKTFEALTPEQQSFVKTQHQLSFEYFKQQDFDKALFEIEKIFQILDDYKDAREIQRYAQEGKRKILAQLEENKRKQEAIEIQKKVDRYLNMANKLYQDKKFPEALNNITEIFLLDPQNPVATSLQETIIELQKQLELQELAKKNQENIIQNILKKIETTNQMIEEKKFLKALKALKTIKESEQMNALESKSIALKAIEKKEEKIKSIITSYVGPLLEEAISLKNTKEESKAYKAFEKVLEVDPDNSIALNEMYNIFEKLHEQAKFFYREGVISESVSDFQNAKKNFEACKNIAPSKSIYYEKSSKKLSHYFYNPTTTENPSL